jgi:PIN domain nuclease of toxin-antitoxin system
MSEVVLDASAVLALLNAETGAGIVQEALPDAVISSVNLAEVVARLAAVGMPETQIQDTVSMLGLEILPFTAEQAYLSGCLYPQTQSAGLSLGDRACLALAAQRAVPVLTADRAWRQLGTGIQVRLIR